MVAQFEFLNSNPVRWYWLSLVAPLAINFRGQATGPEALVPSHENFLEFLQQRSDGSCDVGRNCAFLSGAHTQSFRSPQRDMCVYKYILLYTHMYTYIYIYIYIFFFFSLSLSLSLCFGVFVLRVGRQRDAKVWPLYSMGWRRI